jgi:hypothetical protein
MEEDATRRTSASAAETRRRARRSFRPSEQEGQRGSGSASVGSHHWWYRREAVQGSQSDGGSGAMRPRSRRGGAIAIGVKWIPSSAYCCGSPGGVGLWWSGVRRKTDS